MASQGTRPSLSRSNTTEAQAAYHHEAETSFKLALNGNLFTSAFVTSLRLPSAKGAESPWDRRSSLVGTVGAMTLVTLIQLLMAWTVYLHVQNDLIETKVRPLYTAFEMFVGTNVTMPLGTVVQLCGQWEDQEMKHGQSQGELYTMNMPDGSVYSADDSYSFFYNLKQPTRSWDYGRLGSERSVIDDVMFVLSEGVSLNPATPSGYSLLFILMLAIFFFAIFVEIRQILQFGGMLWHFHQAGHAAGDAVWKFNKEQDSFDLQSVPRVGLMVGVLGIFQRLVVNMVLLLLGTIFLMYTSLKIDLILNGLAILFVLELDKVIYTATVPAYMQKFIEDVAPVTYMNPGGTTGSSLMHQVGPVLMFPINFMLAVGVRAYQCNVFSTYFRLTAAVCLFAGPTVPFADLSKMSPVAGFCDSLLGVSCAPHVSSNETRDRHGYCIVTDQTTMMYPTVQYYLDDPQLFDNRYNEDGSMKSWVEWGAAAPKLYQSDHWMDGPYQDLLRKNCLQLYQKTSRPDDVLVDDDVGETMDAAPFWCAREPLFDAVFGDVVKEVGKKPTKDLILLTKGLRDPDVVKAMDDCKVPGPLDGNGAQPASMYMSRVETTPSETVSHHGQGYHDHRALRSHQRDHHEVHPHVTHPHHRRHHQVVQVDAMGSD